MHDVSEKDVDVHTHNSGISGESGLTYSKAGVDIAHSDSLKQDMAAYLTPRNPRVLNGLGPFASLYDFRFEDITSPVLVLKSEEPGSKQKLAMKYGHTESICHDMINHLVNDIIVMGAKPLAVLDTIVCGSADKDVVNSIIKGISEACRENECDLVGGETSIQPGVVDEGTYILTASIAGVVDKVNIIDGSKIRPGDKIIALASNGLHTNGYTLVRLLMEAKPGIEHADVGGETFIDAIMKPHTPYYCAVKRLLSNHNHAVHGLAHITGGGIEGNLSRIIPGGLSARIDLGKLEVPQVFKFIKTNGNIADDEMLRTFNCGVGLIAVVDREAETGVVRAVSEHCRCYTIGEIAESSAAVVLYNKLNWE